MTWWKRLVWGSCAFLALGLYVLPMLFQQVAIIYQFPKQWTIGLGLLLIFLVLLVFVVVAKKTGILSQSEKNLSKRRREANCSRPLRHVAHICPWDSITPFAAWRSDNG